MSLPLRQRGAAGLMLMVMLAMAVIFSALAIDTGRLGWEAGRLQKIADLAAVDTMTEAGLCSGVTTLDHTAMEAAAQASAARNGYSGDLVAEGGVAAGTLTTVGHLRTFAPSAIADADAVQVTARHTVTSSLVAGGWLGGTTTLQRQAIAYDEVLGGFSAGSFLASVNSDDSLVLNAVLGGLLGGSVNLSATSYQGLADAQVTLESLATAAGPGGVGVSAGTLDGLLQTQLTAGEFLQVIATAMTSGNAVYADIDALATVATNVNSIIVGDLLTVTGGGNPGSAGSIALNVFDLVSATAQISNEGDTVALPMSLNLPLGLGDVTVMLHIVEGPRYAFGPPGIDSSGDWITQVKTGHARLEIRVTLTGGLPILSGLVAVSGELSLYTDVAPASAWLETIQCANADTLSHIANIGAQTGAAVLGIGRFDDISDPASAISSSPTLNINVAGGLASLTATLSASSQLSASQGAQLGFVVNAGNPLPQTRATGTSLGEGLNSATASLAASLDVDVQGGGLLGLVGLSVPLIETGLNNELLSPLLASLDELLLDPLFRALGIHFGGVDARLYTILRGDPRLAG